MKRYLIVILFLLLSSTQAHAGVINLEGKVKSVDLQNNVIEVQLASKSIKLDISKNAKISLDGKPSDLRSIKTGQAIELEVHDGLEIVVKIEASNKSDGAVPSVAALNELNRDSPNFAPWISADGLTIFWTRQESIWTAERKNADEPFKNQRRLFDGVMPSVTADGLYMVLCRPVKIGNRNLGRKIFSSSRKSTQDKFTTPVEIRELRDMGVLMAPCISPDGLNLYVSGYGPEEKQKGHWVVTRKSKSSKWDLNSKKRILPHPNPIPVTTPFVSEDGLLLFLTNRTNTSKGAFGELLIMSRDNVNAKEFTHIQEQVKVNGELVTGRFPRYCPATKELFFSAPVLGERDSEGIWCVKNYEVGE